MDIKNGLKALQWHSNTAKYTLSNIIDILDKLDVLDNINQTTDDERQDLIGQKDDETVKFYNCLQAFSDYQEEFRNKLCSTGLETELTSKLLENDTDPDEVIRRSGEIYAGIFQEYFYPNVWEEADFKRKIESLKTDLKDRIVNRLMREDEIPEFKERLVVSGLNEDFIRAEPMTLERATRLASDWVLWLDLYLHNVCLLQNEVVTILDKAYSTLNPQPDITQGLPTIFNQFGILRDNHRVRNAFVYAMEENLMEVEGAYFKWLRKRQLLAYFCKRISNVLIPDADKIQWVEFNRMFIAKRGKEYEIEDNESLRRCDLDYETKTRTHTKDTPPDGWELVEMIISKAKV